MSRRTINPGDCEVYGGVKPAEHILLHHDDVKAVNTGQNPNNVAPTAGSLCPAPRRTDVI